MASLAPHAPGALVCVGARRAWTRADLARDVGAAVAALSEVSGPPSPGASRLVVCRSRYAFTVGLLACWERGEVALLPANLAQGALEELAVGAAMVVHDGGGAAALAGLDLGAVLGREAAPAALARPDADAVLVRLSTSGSTGGFRFFDKVARQILGEPEVLGARFGVGPGARVLATIPPHHIYGLLFSVLLPLLHGGVLVDDSPMYPAGLGARLRETGARVLVTVPAHLRVVAEAGLDELGELDRVFSSGAPLPARTARALVGAHGLHVTEVFGSTETGGIAWRQRLSDPLWEPLPGVRVDEGPDGRLLLDSPFLPPAAPRPWAADDRVLVRPDGRFEHLGRLDDVVKIASKRVSLGAVERALLDVTGVEDAAVVALSGPEGRVLLRAAVVAPDVDPVAVRAELGRGLDPVAVPKLVFVDALPRAENGKLRRDALLVVVGAPRALAVRQLALDGDRLEAEVTVPEGCAWFEGHFPDHPLLPGVVQLHELVEREARRAWPSLGSCVGVPAVRFRAPIGPGEVLRLVLVRDPAAREVRFELSREGTRCTAGVARFAAASGPGERGAEAG